jgi:hypothetical protein
VYNKIFTKILDSSIWLEPDSTRIVWITMIAAMDETGFCHFAALANLARRANVSLRAAKEAVKILESADKESGDPEFEGRRIERVNGGWIVLNAEKYRNIVTKVGAQEANRKRVARHREKKRLAVTSNAGVMPANGSVMQSEAYAYAYAEAEETTITPEMVASGVLQELCLSGRDLVVVLDGVCRARIKAGDDPTRLRDAMIAAHKEWVAADLSFRPGLKTFFGEGLWDKPQLWQRRSNGTNHGISETRADRNVREAIELMDREEAETARGDDGRTNPIR